MDACRPSSASRRQIHFTRGAPSLPWSLWQLCAGLFAHHVFGVPVGPVRVGGADTFLVLAAGGGGAPHGVRQVLRRREGRRGLVNAAGRCDTDWKRCYVPLAMRRQRNITKMAMALARNPRPPQWAAANGDHLWGAAEVELDARLSFLYSALAWRSTGMFESASLQVAKKSS